MGFDKVTLPPDRERPEKPPWTNWVVLIVVTAIVVAGLIYFLGIR